MFFNKYKYGLVDLSYLLNRNIFSCCKLKGLYNFTAGDVVRSIIITLTKISRDHGITVDKLILLNDTWEKDYPGYHRTFLLDGLYKTSRKHYTKEDLEKLKQDPNTPEKILITAEKDIYNEA